MKCYYHRQFPVAEIVWAVSLVALFAMESAEAKHVLEGIHLPPKKTLMTSLRGATGPYQHGVENANVTNQTDNGGDAQCHRRDHDHDHHHQLRFNGAGVRSIRMLGWDFKVYVAGFYTSAPLESAESVFAAVNDHSKPHPMQMDFTFLRSVNQGRVTDAWTQQTEHSVEFTYPEYEQDRSVFINCFGPIENGGTETVQLLPDGKTVIIDQGIERGVIHGKDFQRAFLSMWFGSKAVAGDLKAGLLGNVHHFGLQPINNNNDISVNDHTAASATRRASEE